VPTYTQGPKINRDGTRNERIGGYRATLNTALIIAGESRNQDEVEEKRLPGLRGTRSPYQDEGTPHIKALKRFLHELLLRKQNSKGREGGNEAISCTGRQGIGGTIDLPAASKTGATG